MEGSLVAYKVFTNGSVLNASEINDNLMNQSVMVFSNSTARSAAIPSPIEGMLTYLEDTGLYESYDGSSFVPFGAGGGKILQIVSTCKTDTYSLNTAGFNDITGLAVTITPTSATSKVMVFLTIGTVDASASSLIQGDVTRDGTPIGVGDLAGARKQSGWFIGTKAADEPQSPAWSFLDSPATTSATTYQARLTRSGGTAYVNRYSTDSSTGNVGRSVSTITVMEVAANGHRSNSYS
jgi:hypothetical protein